MSTPETIRIDEVEYVRRDSIPENRLAETLDGKQFVIVRSHGAGVFAGYVRERNDATRLVVLDRCIRLWRWTGCSLSQVATDGIAGTGENKFAVPNDAHHIFEVLEIIPCTERARVAIQSVKPWKL